MRRVIYLSTTSVYGHGLHRGVSELMLPPHPVSVTSGTRLAAERAVRAVGGIVLRPHLVYGPGDRWFVPTLLRVLRRVPAWMADGQAAVSVIGVDELARVVATLARLPWAPSRDAVFHVSHPRAVTMRSVVNAVYGELGLPPPEDNLPLAVHRALTSQAVPELTDHQFSLLAHDHWYASSRIWRLTGIVPSPPLGGMAEAGAWYRRGFSRNPTSSLSGGGDPETYD